MYKKIIKFYSIAIVILGGMILIHAYATPCSIIGNDKDIVGKSEIKTLPPSSQNVFKSE